MDETSAGTKNKTNRIKKLLVLCIVAVVVIALAVAGILLSRRMAVSMRILRLEGDVRLQTEDGSSRTVTNNLRLQSGNALITAAESLASIGLDKTKIVTLQENSSAEVLRQGKWLQLHLMEGSLFFQVNKALADDETFDIRTATMIVGIRGTSGYVSVDDEGRESLVVTDGHVQVVGTNPVTGEKKRVNVGAGQKIKVYLYNDRPVDSIEFELGEATPEDLPRKVLEIISEDGELLDRICVGADWDPNEILAAAEQEPDTEQGQNQEPTDPTPTPTPLPTATAAPTPTPTPTPTPKPTPAPKPTPTPKPSPSPSPTATPSSTPTPTTTPTPTPTSTVTPTPTPATTPPPTPTPTPPAEHVHKLIHVQYQIEQSGETKTVEYWVCGDCGKSFADADATQPYTGGTIGIG